MSYMKQYLEDKAIEVSTEYPHHDTAFFIYLDNMGITFDENWRDNISNFQESYIGQYDSDRDFFNEMAENSSLFDEVSLDSPLRIYFDIDYWGRDLFIGGEYWRTDGHYFRSY